MIQDLIGRKQLSILLLVASLIINLGSFWIMRHIAIIIGSLWMMRFIALIIVLALVNTVVLFALRWAAHREGERF